jgi:hypothetical protein
MPVSTLRLMLKLMLHMWDNDEIESGYTTFAPESVYSVVQRKLRKDHNRTVRARKEADRIVEILKLAAAGDDSLLLTVRPEQLHQALISRNADPVFVQYAIKQCDVDGEYYSKFYEMCLSSADTDSDEDNEHE